ncbi:putative mitochondrial amino acid transporter ARG-13 [Calocera viscosa TUFC12733]|uniref:Putative mitochondrial amino acid transporter ARG-13 n=1 Tax=Calocera viscosa (strain TUFC12733) TaxID=1330018 RepID=A0A167P682_CALVF|nr:putative mitochondrial amino acid transporter ARG-13 [Calocera viscosa TUFC12733]
MEEGSSTIHGRQEGNVLRGMKDIAFGSAAGMVSKVFEHPFDLCKVRLQSQVLDEKPTFKGPIDCLYKTYANEGIRGLYRGLPAPIVGAMAENAVLFLANGQLQDLVRMVYGLPIYERTSDGSIRPTQLSLGQVAMAAAGAGAITSFVLTPIELVKCRMQVQMLAAETRSVAALQAALPGIGAATVAHRPTFRELQGPFSIVASVVRTEGLRGLWLGQTGTLLRETGGASAWFGANEAVSRFILRRRAKQMGRDPSEMSKRDLKSWESVVAGACAGVSYNTVLYPADSVKSAIQTEEELRPRGSSAPRPTFIGTFRAIYAAQGIRGLYAGLGITVARSAPSSGMIFLIYDTLVKRFG